MVRIIVKLYGELYEAADRNRIIELEVGENTTVLDVARMLEERFEKLRGRLVSGEKLSDDLIVLVNGRNIEWLEGPKTKLRDGGQVAFFPPAAGG
jgi:molybdopterin synthase sulfur carrier subunit